MKRYFEFFLFGALTLLLFSCSHERKALDIKTQEDLKGLKISVPAGSYYEQKYSSLEGYTAVPYRTETDAIEAMRQGITDVYVSDEVIIPASEFKRLGVKKAYSGEDSFDCAYAFKKGESKYLAPFNEFLGLMDEAGYLDALALYWIEGGDMVPELPQAHREGGALLRYCTVTNMAPMAYMKGGEWMGMDVDIVRRFARWYGIEIEIGFVDLSSAIFALDTDAADIISGCLFVTPTRQEFVDFSRPYFKCHEGVFVPDRDVEVRSSIIKRLELNLMEDGRWRLLVDGLLKTLQITFFSILFGTLLGILLSILSLGRRKWMRSLAKEYSIIIQGTPSLVLLLIMFYVVFAGSGLDATWVAIVTFALTFASSSGGVFTSAVSSVPKGQVEAGLALGFNKFRTFSGIVLPQALQRALPLYSGDCVSLMKATSIVGYIAVQDLTRASDMIRSRTFDALVPLLLVTVIYFVLAWIIRRLLNLLISKKQYD